MRTKTRQIQILLASIKKYMVVAEESSMKVAYIKKLYAEQLQRLVDVTHRLKEKETELQIKEIEMQIKDGQIQKQ